MQTSHSEIPKVAAPAFEHAATPVLWITFGVRALRGAASHASLRMLKKRFGFFRNMSTYEMAELVEMHFKTFFFK